MIVGVATGQVIVYVHALSTWQFLRLTSSIHKSVSASSAENMYVMMLEDNSSFGDSVLQEPPQQCIFISVETYRLVAADRKDTCSHCQYLKQ